MWNLIWNFGSWLWNPTVDKDHNYHWFCDNDDAALLNKEILLWDAIEMNWDVITKMDVFSIKWLNDKKIEEFIFDNTWIDINTKDWIKRINEVFLESIRYYEEYLFRRLSKNFKENYKSWFKTKKDVIDFLKKTLSCGADKQIFCSIAKVVYAMNDLLNNSTLIDLDKKARRFIKKSFRWLQIYDVDFPDLVDETWWVFTKKMKSWEYRTISFNLNFRWKSEDSAILKLINEPKERLQEVIKDNIWIQFEVHNKEDAVFLLEYIFVHIFNKDIKEFRQKKFFEEEEKWLIYKKYWDDLDPDFLDALLWLQCESKAKNNQNYSDIKFNWDIVIKDSDDERSVSRVYWAEIRCVLVDNNNESWLSDHRILDWLKKIFALIRLQWYVSEPYIFRVSKKIIEDSEQNKNEDKINISQERIFNYYISKLYKLVTWTKIPFYTTPNRWNALSWTSIYPNNIHFAKSVEWEVSKIKK